MSNAKQSLVARSAIKCPAEKFYNFFKFNMSDLVKIFPLGFTGVEILQGEEGQVGCVKRWNYLLGVVPLTANVKTEEIDDGGKSIKYSVVEGDLLLVYKSFKATIRVTEGLAECIFEYEKATLLSPPPELYIPLAVTAFTLVDAFLLLN